MTTAKLSDNFGNQISKEVRKNILSESAGFLAAEGTSMLTSLGVVALADIIIPKPIMQYGAQVLGKAVVEPFIDSIDHVMSSVCKLDECKTDTSKSRQERAEQIGKGMIVFSAAYVISMGAKLATRRFWNTNVGDIAKTLKDITPAKLPAGTPFGQRLKHAFTFQWVSPHEKMVFLADEGMHYGSLYLMNNQLAPMTDAMIRGTAKIVQKTTGADDKKAHEVATMWSVWEIPNILGAGAAITAIAGAHAKGWPSGKIGEILANKNGQSLKFAEKVAEKAATSFTHRL